LDPEGSGGNPRYIQQRTGNLIDLRDAASKRGNAIVAEHPMTPFEKITTPIKAALPFLRGGGPGAGISFATGNEGRSVPMMQKAMNAVGEEPANVYPKPMGPYPLEQNPSRMLPGATPRIDEQPLQPPNLTGQPYPWQVNQWQNIGGLKQLPVGKSPAGQGTIVPDILGRPDLRTPYNGGLIEAGPHPAVGGPHLLGYDSPSFVRSIPALDEFGKPIYRIDPKTGKPFAPKGM
jgi:hypothetical protein